jgi:hypothetical protein
VDPVLFNTNPDPAFLLNPDPVPVPDPVPDPDPNKTETERRQFPSQIFFKSKFESNQTKNTGVLPVFIKFLVVKFFKKITKKCIFPMKFLYFLAPGSGSGIRIPNTDPQSH